MRREQYTILKDLSSGADREVFHIRVKASGLDYKMYRLDVEESSLHEWVQLEAKGSVMAAQGFPESMQELSGMQKDLWCFLDAYFRLQKRPQLQHYVHGFSDIRIKVDQKQILILLMKWKVI